MLEALDKMIKEGSIHQVYSEKYSSANKGQMEKNTYGVFKDGATSNRRYKDD